VVAFFSGQTLGFAGLESKNLYPEGLVESPIGFDEGFFAAFDARCQV